jgi:hypothetical protein
MKGKATKATSFVTVAFLGAKKNRFEANATSATVKRNSCLFSSFTHKVVAFMGKSPLKNPPYNPQRYMLKQLHRSHDIFILLIADKASN